MRVLKYSEFDRSEEWLLEIIENISTPINENKDDKSLVRKFLSRLSKDIGFNIGLVTTFGTGITLMMPIVNRLIENSNLSIELNEENLILLCITAISITYLEENRNKTGEELNPDGEESLVKRKDAQTMLAELKMRGIGNGIVKKVVKILQGIGKFFRMLFKGTPYVIDSLLDMFAYTSIALPCMNAISLFVGKYDMNLDNILGNLLSLGTAAGALVSKQGINWLMNKLKKTLNIQDLDVPDEDEEMIISPYDMIDIDPKTPEGSELIKEHD